MTTSGQGEGRETLREVWNGLEGHHGKMRLYFNALEGAEDQEAALAALERLRVELEAHFAMEEGPGGLYASIGAETRGAAAVLGDHHRLREVITSARAELETLARPRAAEIHAATLELGTELRGHERREHALVQRVLSDDAA